MAENTTATDKKLESPDYSTSRMGGDFRLREVSIHSRNNQNVIHLNAPGVFVSLDIYEDFFSNVLKGTLDFIDNQGLAETIPIIGDEDLVISFGTPGSEGTGTDFQEKRELASQDKSEETTKQIFKIYDCQEVNLTEGQAGKAYRLYFVSYEYVLNLKRKISKGYKGKFYHTIVKDALDKINEDIIPKYQKSHFIEKTATPQNVIIPNWNPFQAINFCASRSVSYQEEESEHDDPEKNQLPFAPGSLFVFYEKLGTGFFYESIESMIIKQRAKRRVPLYQYTPKSATGRTENIALDYFGVDRYEIRSSFKTLENLGNGMYGSKLIAYDPVRMKYDEIKFDYYKKEGEPETERVDEETGVTEISTDPTQAKDDSQRIFADFIATDIHPKDKMQNKLISEKSDYLGSNDASIRLATTTKEHDVMFISPPSPAAPNFETVSTSIGVTSKTFKDNDAKPNKVENWLLQRDAQIQEFDNIIVAFTVSGNSSRHVGDLVRFEIPSSIPPDTGMGAIDVGHQLYSGYYLISKIHHSISSEEYTTDLELIKNSFAKRIPGQTTEVSTES